MIDILSVQGDILARLEMTTLVGADFSGGTFREADFSGHNLSGANFHAANLELAKFVNCQLGGADLSHADLRHACFDDADLTGANLSHAVLTPAELNRANLCGTDLTRADLHGAHLKWAKYDRATRWPEGFDPEAHGCVPASAGEGEVTEAEVKALLKEHRGQEAVDRLKAGLVDHPRDARLNHLLGCAYACLDDFDYALKHFQRSLDADFEQPLVHYDVAVLYARLHLPTQAVTHLNHAVRMAPHNEKITRLLAEMRARAKH